MADHLHLNHDERLDFHEFLQLEGDPIIPLDRKIVTVKDVQKMASLLILYSMPEVSEDIRQSMRFMKKWGFDSWISHHNKGLKDILKQVGKSLMNAPDLVVPSLNGILVELNAARYVGTEGNTTILEVEHEETHADMVIRGDNGKPPVLVEVKSKNGTNTANRFFKDWINRGQLRRYLKHIRRYQEKGFLSLRNTTVDPPNTLLLILPEDAFADQSEKDVRAALDKVLDRKGYSAAKNIIRLHMAPIGDVFQDVPEDQPFPAWNGIQRFIKRGQKSLNYLFGRKFINKVRKSLHPERIQSSDNKSQGRRDFKRRHRNNRRSGWIGVELMGGTIAASFFVALSPLFAHFMVEVWGWVLSASAAMLLSTLATRWEDMGPFFESPPLAQLAWGYYDDRKSFEEMVADPTIWGNDPIMFQRKLNLIKAKLGFKVENISRDPFQTDLTKAEVEDTLLEASKKKRHIENSPKQKRILSPKGPTKNDHSLKKNNGIILVPLVVGLFGIGILCYLGREIFLKFNSLIVDGLSVLISFPFVGVLGFAKYESNRGQSEKRLRKDVKKGKKRKRVFDAINKAARLNKEGNYEETMRVLKRAQRKNLSLINEFLIQRDLGANYARWGQPQESILEFQKALELIPKIDAQGTKPLRADPDRINEHESFIKVSMATQMRKLGDYDGAIDMLTDANGELLSIFGFNKKIALTLLAQLLGDVGAYDQGIDFLSYVGNDGVRHLRALFQKDGRAQSALRGLIRKKKKGDPPVHSLAYLAITRLANPGRVTKNNTYVGSLGLLGATVEGMVGAFLVFEFGLVVGILYFVGLALAHLPLEQNHPNPHLNRGSPSIRFLIHLLVFSPYLLVPLVTAIPLTLILGLVVHLTIDARIIFAPINLTNTPTPEQQELIERSRRAIEEGQPYQALSLISVDEEGSQLKPEIKRFQEVKDLRDQIHQALKEFDLSNRYLSIPPTEVDAFQRYEKRLHEILDMVGNHHHGVHYLRVLGLLYYHWAKKYRRKRQLSLETFQKADQLITDLMAHHVTETRDRLFPYYSRSFARSELTYIRSYSALIHILKKQPIAAFDALRNEDANGLNKNIYPWDFPKKLFIQAITTMIKDFINYKVYDRLKVLASTPWEEDIQSLLEKDPLYAKMVKEYGTPHHAIVSQLKGRATHLGIEQESFVPPADMREHITYFSSDGSHFEVWFSHSEAVFKDEKFKSTRYYDYYQPLFGLIQPQLRKWIEDHVAIHTDIDYEMLETAIIEVLWNGLGAVQDLDRKREKDGEEMSGGLVRLAFRLEPERLWLEVEDQGIGFPALEFTRLLNKRIKSQKLGGHGNGYFGFVRPFLKKWPGAILKIASVVKGSKNGFRYALKEEDIARIPRAYVDRTVMSEDEVLEFNTKYTTHVQFSLPVSGHEDIDDPGTTKAFTPTETHVEKLPKVLKDVNRSSIVALDKNSDVSDDKLVELASKFTQKESEEEKELIFIVETQQMKEKIQDLVSSTEVQVYVLGAAFKEGNAPDQFGFELAQLESWFNGQQLEADHFSLAISHRAQLDTNGLKNENFLKQFWLVLFNKWLDSVPLKTFLIETYLKAVRLLKQMA